MTVEEKKSRLSRYLDLWKEIEIKQQEIEMLRSKAEKITASFSLAPGSGKGKNTDFTLTVDRIVALQNDLAIQINTALKEREHIEFAIQAVKSPLCRRVLERKYINGVSFDKIARDEEKSYNHIVSRIHPTALEMLNL